MVKYRVINSKDFIKAKPSGDLDLEASIKILATIASIAKSPSDYEVLLDIRDVNIHKCLTLSEVFAFVKEMVKNRSAFRNKIAILSRDDKQLDNSRFAELCAINRGLTVKSFVSFEEGIEWLTSPLDIS